MKDHEFERLLQQSIREHGHEYFDEPQEMNAVPHTFPEHFLDDITNNREIRPVLTESAPKRKNKMRRLRIMTAAAAVILLAAAVVIVPQMMKHRVETTDINDTTASLWQNSSKSIETSQPSEKVQSSVPYWSEPAHNAVNPTEESKQTPAYTDPQESESFAGGTSYPSMTEDRGDHYAYQPSKTDQHTSDNGNGTAGEASLPSMTVDGEDSYSYQTSETDQHTSDDGIDNAGETGKTEDALLSGHVYSPQKGMSTLSNEQLTVFTIAARDSMDSQYRISALPDGGAGDEAVSLYVSAVNGVIEADGRQLTSYSVLLYDEKAYLTAETESEKLYYALPKGSAEYRVWDSLLTNLP